MNAIGFTGSQATPSEPQRIRLFLVLCELFDAGHQTMHNGDCIGSDDLAYKIFRAMGPDARIHGHIPDIDKKRAHNKYDIEYQPLPYLKRNKNIVDRSCVLVATPDSIEEKQRSGTWSTVRYAREKKVAIIIVWPDGSVTTEG